MKQIKKKVISVLLIAAMALTSGASSAFGSETGTTSVSSSTSSSSDASVFVSSPEDSSDTENTTDTMDTTDASDVLQEQDTDSDTSDAVPEQDVDNNTQEKTFEKEVTVTPEAKEDTAQPEDPAQDAQPSAETESEGSVFDTQKLSDGTEDLDQSDFSSNRLVVLTDDKSIIDESEDIVAEYDDLYIIQYETDIQAMNAYIYYADTAEAVEPDMTLTAADEIVTDEEADVTVTKEENPLALLVEATEESESTTAFSMTQASQDPVIALLDTGASLSDNVIEQVSMIGDEMVSAESTHGEDMARLIISQNEDALISSIRVLDDEGKGTISSVIAGIEYAIEQNVDYINLSLYSKNNLAGSVLTKEIKKAIDAGIVVIGAAGNSSTYANQFVPGAVEEALIIGAVDMDGVLMETSNYGDTVDYYVVAENTSEATALFTGYLSKNGVDSFPVEGFIFEEPVDEDDITIEMTHDAAPEEILKNVNQDYIKYDDDTEGYGLVAAMEFKRTYVQEEYIEDSIDEYFEMADENPEDNGFITTSRCEIALYDINAYSNYVVGILNIDNEEFKDVDFAKRNNDGIVLDDEYYDAKTGLVYVKKSDLLTFDEENLYMTYDDVQAQALISSDADIISNLIDNGVIMDKMYESFEGDEEVYAAELVGNEAPVPTGLIPEIVGQLREGDSVTFTVDPQNGATGATFAYLYSVHSSHKNEFYIALQSGNLAEVQRIWSNVDPTYGRYNQITWGVAPPYAGYKFHTNSISNPRGSSSALIDWANALRGMNLYIDMDCTHIVTGNQNTSANNITATAIEVGSNYAVIGLLSSERFGTTQALAGIYIVAYQPSLPPTTTENPRITIHKVDEDGNALQGARFTVYGWDGNGYNRAIATQTTNSNGETVFSLSTSHTENGLFLVRETTAPSGYTMSEETYLNAQDEADFNRYGGRLFWVPRNGGDCVAYRDTEAITVFEDDNSNRPYRLVYDHDGFFVAESWNQSSGVSISCAWWSASNQSDIKWLDMGQLSSYNPGTGSVSWRRSVIDINDYMNYSGNDYSCTIHAHAYVGDTCVGAVNATVSGNFYGGNGGPDWEGRINYNGGYIALQIFNIRRDGKSYKFRVVNNTSSALKIVVPTWTEDGNQSDIVWINNSSNWGNSIPRGGYADYDADWDQFDNLARLRSDVYIGTGTALGRIQPVRTQEYDAGLFVNKQNVFHATATVTKTDTGSTRLSGATFALEEWTGSGDNWTRVTTGTTNTNGQVTFSNITTSSTNDGYFRIREITAPTGYTVSNVIKYIHVTRDGQTFTTGTTSRTGSTSTSLTWQDTPYTASARVTKTNTDDEPLAGAVFTLYQWNGSSYVSTGRTATTGSNGQATFTGITYSTTNQGRFMIRETTAPNGYDLSDGGDKYIRITSNGQVITSGTTAHNGGSSTSLTWENEPNREIKIVKSSADPEVTDGNDMYSLEGAVYLVYSSYSGGTPVSGMSNTYTGGRLSGYIGSITTDARGEGTITGLKIGTYYLIEDQAPVNYESSIYVYEVETTTTNAEVQTRIDVVDEPGVEPDVMAFHKTWDGDNTDTIHYPAGTQFTVTYYDGYYDTESQLPSTYTRQWVFEAKVSRGNDCGFQMTEDYLVEDLSDELYVIDGITVLPIGTYKIQETKAAPGYTLASEIRDEDGNIIATSTNPDQAPAIIRQVTQASSGAEGAMEGGTEYTAYDAPVNGNVRIVKYDTDGSTPLQGVTFKLSDSDGNEVATVTTNANGEAVFNDLYPDVYTLVETATVEGHELLADEITITLPMTLSEEEAADQNLNTSADGVIYVPEMTDVDGNVTPAHYLILDQTYNISNSATFEMPMSGGEGMWIAGFAGVAMAAAAAVVLISGKKKKELI